VRPVSLADVAGREWYFFRKAILTLGHSWPIPRLFPWRGRNTIQHLQASASLDMRAAIPAMVLFARKTLRQFFNVHSQ